MSNQRVIEKGKKHHHQAPKCPECDMPSVAPLQARDGWDLHAESIGANHLWCTCCGYDWESDDHVAIARAWYGHGAYEALANAGVAI